MNNVSVIGACGKMGRGIALLLLQEMALQPDITHLKLIDIDESAYYPLKVYLRQQLTRFAEKNINRLRSLYEKDRELVSNAEMIQAFSEKALSLVDCSPLLASLQGSELVFEAVFENIPLKIEVLKEVHKIAPSAYVFTNTSSIPIGYLAEESHLGSALIGYHFYNPPAIQKLLEIIPSVWTDPNLETFAFDLGRRLDKIMVKSADIAGFIGNGHFAQEIILACQLAKEYSPEMVDQVTRDYLLRPMGIFQLVNYVGLPIVKQILKIMDLDCDLDHFAAIKYSETTRPLSWKQIQKNPKLLDEVPGYFKELAKDPSEEAKLALLYLNKSKEIVESLVARKVAASKEDVGLVLKHGFYHLYSPHEVI